MATQLLDRKMFQLDASGVAGFFGGDEAVSAMATVHIHRYRRFLGWYNSPGSYHVAKKYGQLARSKIWLGLFSGDKTDPTTFFGLDGTNGPRYIGFYSGTEIGETGHIASLLMRQCEESKKKDVEGGRQSEPFSVTLVDFKNIPDTEVPLKLKKPKLTLLALIPILVSLGGSAVCGFLRDWYCFSMILLGVITSGLSCLAIGSGTLLFTHAEAAKGAPLGDGFMKSNKGVVVVRGKEGAVNTITRGRFVLHFGTYKAKTDHEHNRDSKPRPRSEPKFIGTCSMLLFVQFLAHLLLIPQGSLLGQIIFLSTLAVSWLYNSILASLDKNQIQRELLMDKVWKRPIIRGYMFGNWTSMTTFTLLAARPPNPQKLMDDLIPNDTEVWRRWKHWMLENLQSRGEKAFDDTGISFEGLNSDENSLLSDYVIDAQIAYRGFQKANYP